MVKCLVTSSITNATKIGPNVKGNGYVFLSNIMPVTIPSKCKCLVSFLEPRKLFPHGPPHKFFSKAVNENCK